MSNIDQLAKVLEDSQPAGGLGNFEIATIIRLTPLAVTIDAQTYQEDEIVLARQLTERIEDVTPLGWVTSPTTCTASHAHAIPENMVKLKIHSPLKVGQRLLVLPTADEQMIYAVDIIP